MYEIKVIAFEFELGGKQRVLSALYAEGWRLVGVCGNTGMLERPATQTSAVNSQSPTVAITPSANPRQDAPPRYNPPGKSRR